MGTLKKKFIAKKSKENNIPKINWIKDDVNHEKAVRDQIKTAKINVSTDLDNLLYFVTYKI